MYLNFRFKLEKLTPNFRFDTQYLEKKLQNMKEELKNREFDVDVLRDRLRENDFKIKKLKPKRPSDEVEFLVVDSSIVKNELRFYALWAIHSVVLRACFDNNTHTDPLIGDEILYKNLMYNSYVDLGQIRPYKMVDERVNIIRISNEYKSLGKSYMELDDNGINIDFMIIDGSLYTNLQKLRKFRDDKGLKEFQRLRDNGKLIGMVEDSNAGDIAYKINANLTNLLLFDLVLNKNEFVIDRKGKINICYIKLPPKILSYTPDRRSKSMTVRWEFSYENFKSDLENIVAIWLLESDLFHPQIYPLRLADYLTRKIRMHGLIENLIKENEIELKYRDLRESML